MDSLGLSWVLFRTLFRILGSEFLDFAASILDNRGAEPIGFRLENTMANPSRVVLLTGAAGGIGRVMTQALLADGHKVAAVDRDAASLDTLKTLCGGSASLHLVLADLGGEAGCMQAVEAARSRFGAIDAVINNAGIGQSWIRADAGVRHPGIDEETPETL